MAIETHPRPDNIPQRPRLTVRALSGLIANPDDHPYPSTDAAEWLIAIRAWQSWAADYCARLDAVYVEHQAIAHDCRVEPGALADAGSIGYHHSTDDCKVCAYLYEQYETNRL